MRVGASTFVSSRISSICNLETDDLDIWWWYLYATICGRKVNSTPLRASTIIWSSSLTRKIVKLENNNINIMHILVKCVWYKIIKQIKLTKSSVSRMYTHTNKHIYIISDFHENCFIVGFRHKFFNSKLLIMCKKQGALKVKGKRTC